MNVFLSLSFAFFHKFLRTTMSLTMVVSKDTYLWTLEVYYRYMSKLIYPRISKVRGG